MHDFPRSEDGPLSNASLLTIDSRSRISGGTSDNFIVNLPSGYSNVRGIKLQSAEIPFTWYEVNDSNNVVDFDEGGVRVQGTIPPGNYTPSSFATALQNSMDSISPGPQAYTVTYSSVTGTYSVGAPGAFTMFFTDPASIYQQLGADLGQTIGPTNTIIFTNVSVLSSNTYVYISLGTMNSNVSSAYTTFNYKVPINVEPYSVCFYTSNTEWDQINYYGPSPISFNSLNVRLTFWNGSSVDLNGAEWSMTLTIYS